MKKVLKILFVILAVLLVLFILHLGIGIGFGSGSGNGKSNHDNYDANNETDLIKEKTKKENNFIKITVSGEEYIYESEKIELEDLLRELEKHNSNDVVEIVDQNASKNAYDKLEKGLEEKQVKYEEKMDENVFY